MKQKEKTEIEDMIKAQTAEFEARKAKEMADKKSNQMDILRQMNEKDRVRRQFL